MNRNTLSFAIAFVLTLAWFLLPNSGMMGPASGAAAAGDPPGSQVAIFAGGCFWCVESDFDKVPGVISTTSGYTGGTVPNPSYEDVSSGTTGHAESVRVVFDPKLVTYDRLLYVFWRSVDPVTRNSQFCDYGTQYRTAIFYVNDEQKQKALASREALEKSGRLKRPIVTEIAQAGPFYPAEDYHQNYYQKNPFRYNLYRYNCGRDDRLKELWGSEAGGGTH